MEHQGQPERANAGKAERVRVFSGEGQVEISKFDKEARQDYVFVVPDREYRKYADGGIPIEKAFSDLSEEQHEYLRSHLTPGEQRIVRDPAYGQTVQNLIDAPAPALARERAAILERAISSQLEPYDYHLSFRHQTFNAALKQRPDVNQIVKEIDWVRDISQAQYRFQLTLDPSFTPEKRAAPQPLWVEEQLKTAERVLHSAALTGKGKVETPKVESTVVGAPNASVLTLVSQAGTQSVNSATFSSATEAFKRAESLTSTMLGSSARTIPAQVDSGIYRGPILAETSDLVLQRLSARAVVAHQKALFEPGQSPTVGESFSIVYSKSKPLVRELKDHSKTVMER